MRVISCFEMECLLFQKIVISFNNLCNDAEMFFPTELNPAFFFSRSSKIEGVSSSSIDLSTKWLKNFLRMVLCVTDESPEPELNSRKMSRNSLSEISKLGLFFSL